MVELDGQNWVNIEKYTPWLDQLGRLGNFQFNWFASFDISDN